MGTFLILFISLVVVTIAVSFAPIILKRHVARRRNDVLLALWGGTLSEFELPKRLGKAYDHRSHWTTMNELHALGLVSSSSQGDIIMYALTAMGEVAVWQIKKPELKKPNQS